MDGQTPITPLEQTEDLKDVILQHLGHNIKFHAYKPGYANPFAKQPVYHDVCIECETCDEILWSYETQKDIILENK